MGLNFDLLYFMKLLLKTILIIFIGLFSNHAIAGWVISEVSSDKYGNKQYQTTFIQNNIIRFETEISAVIINLNTKNIMLLFEEYELYWQGNIKEFKQDILDVFEQKLHDILLIADSSQKLIAQNMINELKEQYKEEDSNTDIKFDIKIDETYISENIAGFKANKYSISLNDSIVEYIWITDSINPYKDIDIESMISFTNQLSPEKSENSVERSLEYLNLIKTGLAVKSQEKNPNGGFFTTIVNSVSETNIDNEYFLAPSNYHKAQLAEIMLITDNEQYRQE